MGKKMTFTFSRGTVETLETLSERNETTLTESLKRSIATYKFLKDEVRSGKRLCIEHPDGALQEILL